MANDPLENSKISGNFSEPKSKDVLKFSPEPFSPPAYVALALELACQMLPVVYREDEVFSPDMIVNLALRFQHYLEQTPMIRNRLQELEEDEQSLFEILRARKIKQSTRQNRKTNAS